MDDHNANGAVCPPLTLDAFLPYRLSVLSNRISRLIARDYAAQFSITIPQWRVLVILSEQEVATATDIAEASQMDKVAVSRAVKALIDRGFIVRRADQRDGRVAMLHLTDEGLGLFANVAPLAAAREKELLSSLEEQDRAHLMRIVKILDRRVGEMRAADGVVE